MFDFDETLLISLNSVDGLYSNKQRELLELFGGASALAEEFSSCRDVALKAVSPKLYDEIKQALDGGNISRAVEKAVAGGVRVTTLFSDDYPAALRDIPEPPTVLYYKGDLKLLDKSSVSVVGSRKCSDYGRRVARYFTERLAERLVIISGMAYGIDETAHKTALDCGGETVAVMGSGFNRIYPSGHKWLCDRIAEQGLVLTEFPPDAPPNQFHFPMRNRIISGLSDGVLIVEAGRKSGTQTTLNHALDQGKRVYIVPNDIFSQCSVGSNEMLKNLQGALVTSPEDILADMGLDRAERQSAHQLTFGEQNVADKLAYGKKHFNQLLEETKLAVSELQYILSDMEIKGLLIRLAGNEYQLTMEGIK